MWTSFDLGETRTVLVAMTVVRASRLCAISRMKHSRTIFVLVLFWHTEASYSIRLEPDLVPFISKVFRLACGPVKMASLVRRKSCQMLLTRLSPREYSPERAGQGRHPDSQYHRNGSSLVLLFHCLDPRYFPLSSMCLTEGEGLMCGYKQAYVVETTKVDDDII